MPKYATTKNPNFNFLHTCSVQFKKKRVSGNQPSLRCGRGSTKYDAVLAIANYNWCSSRSPLTKLGIVQLSQQCPPTVASWNKQIGPSIWPCTCATGVWYLSGLSQANIVWHGFQRLTKELVSVRSHTSSGRIVRVSVIAQWIGKTISHWETEYYYSLAGPLRSWFVFRYHTHREFWILWIFD